MSYTQLTDYERYQIYSLKKAGHNQKEISHLLSRSPSTISRELKRNTGLRGYRPAQAQKLSDNRRSEARKYRKVTPKVYAQIECLLRQQLSPQQVVDYLMQWQKIQLHHETIYQLVYTDKAQGGDLYTHLRIAAKPYRKRYGHNDRRGKLKNRVSIEERPAIVDLRRRVGDWEGDTIIGKNRHSALLTMVERKTLYTIIIRLNGKHANKLADEAIKYLKPIADRLKTLTLDNGLEFAEHQRIAQELGVSIYFAHPYASWERGINENTNGLIRQYFPKRTDFNKVTDEEIQFVMNRLNSRPRATRGGKSPNELFLGQRVDLLAA
ncbi:IS30 family transposase [Sessilibacter sp. MAH4]